jgi:hypothetical protein
VKSFFFAAILFVALHLTGCEGLYGPKAFNYNTSGVVASNLFGAYHLDDTTWVLAKKGYTNTAGSIVLKADMTFQVTDIPCLQNGANNYSTASGSWKIQKQDAIWVVALSPQKGQTLCGFSGLTFPVLKDVPPHGIEIHINHDEGYWVRYAKRID